MIPDMRLVRGFAAGLGKLKAKEEQGQGCDLTPDEVAGIIWAIKNLRGGRDRGTTHYPAER
jgi:hypothetical protein